MTIGYGLTEQLFKEAERFHEDLMEPYSTRLAGAADAAERQRIMRQGLAETFRRRYPMPEQCWSSPCTVEEVAAWNNYVVATKERERLARERIAKMKAPQA